MERDLIRAAARGDSGAFEALMTPYEKKIYCLCLRMTGNPHDGEDAAQEAMLRIWQKIGQYREEASFSTWVYRVTASACADALRKRRRETGTSLENLREQGFDAPDGGQTPAQAMEAGERRQAMANAVSGVPEQMRSVFLLRDVHGLSVEETARVLGISQGTIKSRLSRAREKIAAALRRSERAG